MISNISGGRASGASSWSAGDDIADPALALMKLEADAGVTERQSARTDIHDATVRMREARERIREAKEEAKREQEESSSWGILSGDLGSIATVAGCVAAVAATGGVAATVIAGGAALNVGAKVAKDGGFIDDETAAWATTTGSVAIAGASALGGGGAVSATGRAVVAGAEIVGGGASAAQAGAAYLAKDAESASVEAQARAEAHRAERDVAEGHLDRANDAFRKSAQAGRDTAQAVIAMMERDDAARLGVIQNYVRG